MLNASCTSHKYWCFLPSTFTCQRFLRTCSTACMLICVRRRCQGYFAKGSTIRWLWKCDGRNAIAPWRIDSKRASTYNFKNNSFAIMLKGSYTLPFFKTKKILPLFANRFFLVPIYVTLTSCVECMTMSNDWDYLYGVGNWRSRLITLKQSNRWKFLSSCNTLAPLSSRNNNLSCTKPSAQRRLHSWLIYTFPLQSCNFQTNLNKFLDWSHKSFDDLCYNNNRQKDFKPAELIWWLHTKSFCKNSKSSIYEGL